MIKTTIFTNPNASDDELRECQQQSDETYSIMCRVCPHTSRCTGLALKELSRRMREDWLKMLNQNEEQRMENLAFNLAVLNATSVKKIKVTTAFADYLKATTPPLPERPNDLTNGLIGHWDGVPIEVDDEIDGLYEFVY